MTAKPSMERLHRKHAELDEALQREEARVHPDDAAISRMKKQKLRLKDEMMSVEAVDA